MIEQARAFNDAGYGVFPLHPLVAGKCGCGDDNCAALGKHPSIASWQSIPTPWSDEQFENMAEYGMFQTGYGVLCKNLIVIDIDPRNGGAKSWDALLKVVPDLAGCGYIVETGRRDGGKHLYFKAPVGVSLQTHMKDYPGIDARNGSSFVVGPGSIHAAGNTYRAVMGSVDDIDDAPDGLIRLLVRPERHRSEYNGAVVDISDDEIVGMLQFVTPNTGRAEWLAIGMAIHDATGGAGFALWDDWSSSGSDYDSEIMEGQWHSFGKSANPITIGTLIHRAEQGGWVRSVTFGPPVVDTPVVDTDLPCAIDGVDLRKPPGAVGEVAAWMAACCRRKRDNICVGASLVAIGNVGGLRLIDERDRVTGNLVMFGVAGSGTGKESVTQAFGEIHREAGIVAAVHGNIKSDAEVYRNLTRHQACMYNTDEVSDLLEKINGATSKGTNGHMQGVIATIMSVYTKADGYLLVTGDAKEELKGKLLQEAAKMQKALDDGRGSEAALAALLKQVDDVDNGLKYPFLSMAGYGTPEKFYSLMNFRAATEGFFGRAMVFEERDNAPRSIPNFKKPDMPERLKVMIQNLRYGGYYDATSKRIEWPHDRVKVPTDAMAAALLDKIALWMDDKAIDQKETYGLSALYLRGYELVSKVSFILAMAHGVRTFEHVRWAFALVLNDLAQKTRLVVSNDRKMDAPEIALKAKISSILGLDDWDSFGVIKNKARGYRPEDIQRMLDILVESGDVEKQECAHPTNKKVVMKYRKRKGK